MSTSVASTEPKKEPTIERAGDKILVPETLSLDDAITALTNMNKEETKIVGVRADFEMTVPEGIVAMFHALKELYNFISTERSPGFFGGPPSLISIQTGPNETEMVPWGRMVIPGVDGYLEPHWNLVGGLPYFRIVGQVRGKDRATIKRIFDYIEKRRESIYRGKAIRAHFPNIENVGSLEDFFPRFMSVSERIDQSSLVFTRDTEALLQTTLFTPIEYSQACREQGVPLKRGILLSGPFGTGKTLTAAVAAKKCDENGWTFIYLANVADLAKAVQFARRYQPAVIFGEDIDEALSDPDERSEKVNEILNSIDGVHTKDLEIITVLTTNNIKNISRAFLRPGRIDTVVEVSPPDRDAAERLIRLFARERLAENQDLSVVSEMMAGSIPAMIRETVNRANLGALHRQKTGNGDGRVSSEDIRIAALGMATHMNLLKEKEPDTRTSHEKAAGLVADSIRDGFKSAGEILARGATPAPNGKRNSSKSPPANAKA